MGGRGIPNFPKNLGSGGGNQCTPHPVLMSWKEQDHLCKERTNLCFEVKLIFNDVCQQEISLFQFRFAHLFLYLLRLVLFMFHNLNL